MMFAEFSNETGMAIVGGVGAVFAGLWAMLSNRHKLQYDVQMVELRAANKACAEDHKAAAEEVGIVKGELRELRVKYEKCQEHHDTADEERGKIWAEIKALRAGV